MQLLDIQTMEKWIELEEEMYNKFVLCASVFNAYGAKITAFRKWPNNLCPVIQANKKSQSFICAVANRNLAQQARQTKHPVISECDAGMLKLVVPIFVNHEFLGVFSGCGVLVDGSDVETFLIHKTIGMNIAEIDRLKRSINIIGKDGARLLMRRLKNRVDVIIENFVNNSKTSAGVN
jgi:ligand-binding sensor protein